MPRTSRTLRLVLLTASTSLAAGGVLLPSGAFAAPAAPHTTTAPADEDGSHPQDSEPQDSEPQDSEPGESDAKDAETGVVPEGYCNDPKAAPGLCVNGKPLPKGDGSVKVPQGEKPKDSGTGVVPEGYCNDPKAAPGLCVNGKPLPKGDGSVKVPKGSTICLGVDTPEQCAARQQPVVKSPTGSSTAELAV
ncbi:hypothetical protein [Streptomyces sp. SYSU K217416]